MPWDFRKDGKMNLYGDSRRCSDIAYPNTKLLSPQWLILPMFRKSHGIRVNFWIL